MRADFNNHSNNRKTNPDMIRQAVTTAAIVGSVAYMTKVGVVNKLADKFEKSVAHKAAKNANKKFTPKLVNLKTTITKKLNPISTRIGEKMGDVKNIVTKCNPIPKVINLANEVMTKVRKK